MKNLIRIEFLSDVHVNIRILNSISPVIDNVMLGEHTQIGI
jgi:hypothetical protein